MSHVILKALLTLLKHKRENLQIFVALLKCPGKKTVSNFFFLIFSTYRNFTNTRSPIFSSRSPFLTDPVSERLETDSLFVLARLEDGVAGVVAVEAFLAVAVLEGSAVFEATLPTEGVGDAARDVGAV